MLNFQKVVIFIAALLLTIFGNQCTASKLKSFKEVINADIMFLMDGSGSIEFEGTIQWIKSFVGLFGSSNGYSDFCLIQYSYWIKARNMDNQPYLKTEIQFNSTNMNTTNFINKVDQIKHHGYQSPIIGGLIKAKYDFETYGRNDTKRIMILITDSEAEEGELLKITAKDLMDIGVMPFAIGYYKATVEDLKEVTANDSRVQFYEGRDLSNINSTLFYQQIEEFASMKIYVEDDYETTTTEYETTTTTEYETTTTTEYETTTTTTEYQPTTELTTASVVEPKTDTSIETTKQGIPTSNSELFYTTMGINEDSATTLMYRPTMQGYVHIDEILTYTALAGFPDEEDYETATTVDYGLETTNEPTTKEFYYQTTIVEIVATGMTTPAKEEPKSTTKKNARDGVKEFQQSFEVTTSSNIPQENTTSSAKDSRFGYHQHIILSHLLALMYFSNFFAI